MKNVLSKSILLLTLLTSTTWFGCHKDDYSKPVTIAVLATTTAASVITATTVTTGGNVTYDGNSPLTALGVCYDTTKQPVVRTDIINFTSDTVRVGIFKSVIKGLTPNTTYYVRAYAKNAKGTAYGTQMSFKTGPVKAPNVTTVAPLADKITDSGAEVGGNVTADQGSPITARGICWAKTTGPTTAGDKMEEVINTGDGLGPFSKTIPLDSNTTYFVRAYAINALGTSYGANGSFTTKKRP